MEETKKEFLEDYFNNYIFKYAVEDLKVLKEIMPKEEEGLGACAIPQALTVFSLMDLLGSLARGKKPNKEEETTTKNIDYFIKHFFPINNYSQDEINMLVKLCRHGFVHQFFPKSISIIKNKDINRTFDYDSRKNLIFNVCTITNECIEGISILYKRIQGSDKELINKMYEELNKLIEKDRNKFNDFNISVTVQYQEQEPKYPEPTRTPSEPRII